MQRNPMDLVTVKGASKRMRKPHSMTVEEFQKFISHLREPIPHRSFNVRVPCSSGQQRLPSSNPAIRIVSEWGSGTGKTNRN
jgi:hypothetical protein